MAMGAWCRNRLRAMPPQVRDEDTVSRAGKCLSDSALHVSAIQAASTMSHSVPPPLYILPSRCHARHSALASERRPVMLYPYAFMPS